MLVGKGVLEMCKPYQQHASDFFNHWSLNAIITNTKHYIAKNGTIPDADNWMVWANKLTQVNDNPKDAVVAVEMGQMNASLPQAISMAVSFAERRVGVNEMNTPRPSQVLGSRTPGITALTMMQQVNKRFAPAFDAMRLAMADVVRQGLYRLQERLLAGDAKVSDLIVRQYGLGDGPLIIEILKNEHFDEEIEIELTANSASINKEADRQAMAQFMTLLAQYYQRILELVSLAANPATPPEIAEVARKIAVAAGEAMDRAARTFDSVRDPSTFVVQVEEELDQIAVNKEAMAGLMQMLGPVLGAAGGGGAEGGAGPQGQGQGQPRQQGGRGEPQQGQGEGM